MEEFKPKTPPSRSTVEADTKFILKQCEDALRLAANILESRERGTAADRQIDYAERLVLWHNNGRIGPRPGWIPSK